MNKMGSRQWALDQIAEGKKVWNWRWGSGRFISKGKKGTLWRRTVEFESLNEYRQVRPSTMFEDGWMLWERN